jgi:hypothetical protein
MRQRQDARSPPAVASSSCRNRPWIISRDRLMPSDGSALVGPKSIRPVNGPFCGGNRIFAVVNVCG